MIEFAKVAEILSIGGNTALIVLLVLFWRFDRRLLKIELLMTGVLKEQNGILRDMRKNCEPSAVPHD